MSDSRIIKNIALIGFMGTGKSSVGRIIAEQARFQLVDTDDEIERRAGKSIRQIFADEGEPRFREHERALVAELAGLNRVVISTGGGVGANPDHLAALKTHALVICLWASPDHIWERVRHQHHRPLLQDPDPRAKIQRLLAERAVFYRQADVLVNTDLRPLREVAQQVLHHFQLARSGQAEG